MVISPVPESVRLLIAGYGAAGRAYAAGFRAQGAEITAVDPYADTKAQEAAQTSGITLQCKLPDDLDRFDLVVILSPAAASLDIIRQLAARPGTCPILDLTSSEPGTMRDAHEILGARFVDGTVLGAVGLGGVATPMAFAGSCADEVAEILRPLGCQITCLDGAPGSASVLKLLRSLFMKGLEALVIETQLAACALDQSEDLGIALSDLAEVDMPAFLAEMLRTHPKHAGRRTHEVEAAMTLMRNAGFSPVMLPATQEVFRRTARLGSGPDASPTIALQWLDRHLNPEHEVNRATA